MTVGSLSAEGKFLSSAIARCLDGSWKFKRVGTLQSNISIKESNSEIEIALFKKNVFNRNGTILVNKEKKFSINTNYLMSEYRINHEKELLITMTNVTRFPKLSSTIMINSTAINIPELPWLVLFSWYLAVMQHFDLVFNTAAV